MRTPTEFTRTGKCVLPHYKVHEGDGGAYPLLASSDSSATKYEFVPGYRLKIVSVREENLGDVTDDEARLEGLESRLALLDRWRRCHGEYLSAWSVWRYELELIEL